MTPLPKPQPTPRPGRGFVYARRDNFIPMTPSQRLRWENKRRPPVVLLPGDTVRASGEGQGRDEVDDGYLGAIRLQPRLVGLADGQVPPMVATRLLRAGLVEKVVG